MTKYKKYVHTVRDRGYGWRKVTDPAEIEELRVAIAIVRMDTAFEGKRNKPAEYLESMLPESKYTEQPEDL